MCKFPHLSPPNSIDRSSSNFKQVNCSLATCLPSTEIPSPAEKSKFFALQSALVPAALIFSTHEKFLKSHFYLPNTFNSASPAVHKQFSSHCKT